VEQTIRDDMVKLLGPSTRVGFVYADDIPPAPSGKFRWIVSDLTTPQPTSPA
jgi:hypothetical protein